MRSAIFPLILFYFFIFFWNVCRPTYVWPTFLQLGCITNFNMLFLVMGFFSLVDEITFMLISSRHSLRNVSVKRRYS